MTTTETTASPETLARLADLEDKLDLIEERLDLLEERVEAARKGGGAGMTTTDSPISPAMLDWLERFDEKLARIEAMVREIRAHHGIPNTLTKAETIDYLNGLPRTDKPNGVTA